MMHSLQTGFVLVPLALYFLVLGVWHTSRHPRVIPGALDYWLLVFGLSGLVVFGPPGRLMLDWLFPGPSVWASLAVPSFFLILALLRAPQATRRLVVYNIDASTLRDALQAVLGQLPVDFCETGSGYSMMNGEGQIRVEVGERSRIGLIEVQGSTAEALLGAIAEGLRRRLRSEVARPAAASAIWYILAALVLIGPPVAGAVLNRPQIQAAVRVLLDRIRK